MPAPLAALRAHDIHTRLKRLVRMPRMSHHVHHDYAPSMQPLHHAPRRDANGRDEQLGPFLNDHVDELVQQPFCVVVVRLPGGAAEGGEREVDAKGEGGVREEGFELVDHGA